MIVSLVRLELPHLAKARSNPETLDAFNPLISDTCLALCTFNEITATLEIMLQNANVQLQPDLNVSGQDSDGLESLS